MKVGTTQRRSRQHVILKIQGCTTSGGFCGKGGEDRCEHHIMLSTSWENFRKRFLTCGTSAWLWRVASIKRRGCFFAAVGRKRGHLAVLVWTFQRLPSFRWISIFEIFLQPGRNDAFYGICDSTDEACLLQIKKCIKKKQLKDVTRVRGKWLNAAQNDSTFQGLPATSQ